MHPQLTPLRLNVDYRMCLGYDNTDLWDSISQGSSLVEPTAEDWGGGASSDRPSRENFCNNDPE